jgi:hypothetical protein
MHLCTKYVSAGQGACKRLGRIGLDTTRPRTGGGRVDHVVMRGVLIHLDARGLPNEPNKNPKHRLGL